MNICRIKLATGFCKFNLFLNVCYVVYVVMKNLIEQFKNWIYVQLLSSGSFYRSQSGIVWRCVYCVGTLYDELTSWLLSEPIPSQHLSSTKFLMKKKNRPKSAAFLTFYILYYFPRRFIHQINRLWFQFGFYKPWIFLYIDLLILFEQ